MKKKFYRSAHAIISVSQPILDSLSLRHPFLDCKSKSHLITNGFDETDFEKLPTGTKQKHPMTITYTGAFLDKRTPKYFLDAMVALVSSNEIDSKDIMIRFIGYFDDNMTPTVGILCSLAAHRQPGGINPTREPSNIRSTQMCCF